MLSGHEKLPTTSEAHTSIVTATTRVYTIHYTPKGTTDAARFAADKDEIVDWHTEIIDNDDGRVQCITTPVYASASAAETIESTEPLDMATLLARENVCAVTYEEVTRTTVSVQKTSSHAAPVREYEDGEVDASYDALDSPELFEIHQSLFGMPRAIGCLLRQLLDA